MAVLELDVRRGDVLLARVRVRVRVRGRGRGRGRVRVRVRGRGRCSNSMYGEQMTWLGVGVGSG